MSQAAAGRYNGIFRQAAEHYWAARGKGTGVSAGAYIGRRATAVGGKQMDGYALAISDVLVHEGVDGSWISWGRRGAGVIPGWFRATKDWDLLVVEPGTSGKLPVLHAAIELKVLGGPSFGNNANNRAEEAIGNAVDLWKAYREGGFRDGPEPFVGFLIVTEDEPKSRSPIRVSEPFWPVFPEFRDLSYIERMAMLCQRLVAERLYTGACALSTDAYKSGQADVYAETDPVMSVDRFVDALLRRVRPLP